MMPQCLQHACCPVRCPVKREAKEHDLNQDYRSAEFESTKADLQNHRSSHRRQSFLRKSEFYCAVVWYCCKYLALLKILCCHHSSQPIYRLYIHTSLSSSSLFLLEGQARTTELPQLRGRSRNALQFLKYDGASLSVALFAKGLFRLSNTRMPSLPVHRS